VRCFQRSGEEFELVIPLFNCCHVISLQCLTSLVDSFANLWFEFQGHCMKMRDAGSAVLRIEPEVTRDTARLVALRLAAVFTAPCINYLVGVCVVIRPLPSRLAAVNTQMLACVSVVFLD
jgi:hypothetical protein